MAEQTRTLVPTEREVEEGAARTEYVFGSEGPVQRRRFGTAVRDYAKDLDPRTIAGPKLPLAVMGAFFLIAEWDEVAINVLLPDMRADFGFSLAFLGTLASLIAFVTIALGPAMGYLSDRIKRVWMLRIGAIVANAGPILTAAATGVPLLVTGRLLSGVGSGVAKPAAYPLLTDYYPLRSRARVIGFLGFAAGLGVTVGPTIAGFLADAIGWRGAVGTLAGLAFAVSFLFFLLREPRRGYLDRIEMGATEELAAREQRPVSWGEAWRAAGSITTLRRLWYATPFQFAARTGLPTFTGIYLAQEFGVGASGRGAIASGIGVAGMIGILVAAPLADRLLSYRPGRVMALLGASLFFNAACVLVIVFSPWLWLSVAVSLPLGFSQVVLLPAFTTLVSLVVPARIRGLGLQTLAPWQFAGLIMIPFIGSAADSWGIRPGLFLFAPILVIAGTIIGSSGFGVDRDMRSALAASMAEQEAEAARARGGSKMLICRDVEVSYDGVQVLFGVDLDVEQGETLALLGTNGAGKSTLLRAIAGTHEASGGAIFVDGDDITHVPPHEVARLGVVMLPGGNAVFPTLSVEENLRTAAWMYREDEEYVRTRTEQVLGMFPALRDRLAQPAGNLSGGEQQMVALGQAFLMRPRLLMIDELSLGLAPQIVEQLLGTLREIAKQGTTMILVEQSVNIALTIAERAVFMEKGEVRFDGPTTELLAHPELIRSVFMGGAASAGGSLGRARGAVRVEERETLLRVEDAAVSFGGVQALRGATVEVAAGEIVGVIGPNGAGKTTLFDVISGFVLPDDGQVLLEASDVTTLGPDARARLGLGRSFQNARLFPSLTVRENIAVAFERHIATRNPVLAAVWAPAVRRAERRVQRRTDSLIEVLGLDAYADKYVNDLSTGTRRTVDIACVMASEPRVLLLDEPSSGLAQAETEELGPVLTRLVRETGAGMLVIEHDLPLITSISDRLYAMELGAVLVSGPPHEVVADARVAAAYLSASENVLARSDTGWLGELIGSAMSGGSAPRRPPEGQPKNDVEGEAHPRRPRAAAAGVHQQEGR